MRLALEILSVETESRSFTDKRTGELKTLRIFSIQGIDKDYADRIIKINVYDEFGAVPGFALPGAILEVKFADIKPPTNWEKAYVISVPHDNVSLHKTARQVLEEKLKQLANGAATMEKDTTAPSRSAQQQRATKEPAAAA